MSLEIFRKFWLPWTFVALLTGLCATLAVVEYGWINQISQSERNRLEADFRSNFQRLGKDFDQAVETSFEQLQPKPAEIAEWGTVAACIRQFRRWSAASEPLFRRIALVVPEAGEPRLYLLDFNSGDFLPTAWPATWQNARERFEARIKGAPLPPPESALLEAPLANSSTWIIAELSLSDLRSALLPAVAGKYLPPGYDLELLPPGSPAPNTLPFASLELLRFAATPPWRLAAYRRGPGLQDQVTVARASNIALSAGILLLILAIVAVLLHSSRRSQQLAEIQMNFVAGVSHEPRTPLSVIRTAAYNLRGPLAGRPEQVARYAELIQKQSETLSVVVEQVLRYGTANSRRAASERGMVSIRQMLRSLVASATQAPGIDVETSFDPNLPMIPADELALKHALQNLVDNAIKYGTEGSQWVGISARAMVEGAKRQVEIRVADRGPGIPRDEQAHLFEAFFRGRRALQDQINGTGLGLNLVKKIVDAHGGTVRVNSEPGKGAEFIVRLPAAAEELEDVFSNPVD